MDFKEFSSVFKGFYAALKDLGCQNTELKL